LPGKVRVFGPFSDHILETFFDTLFLNKHSKRGSKMGLKKMDPKNGLFGLLRTRGFMVVQKLAIF